MSNINVIMFGANLIATICTCTVVIPDWGTRQNAGLNPSDFLWWWRKYSPSLCVFQKMSCSPLFCCFTLVMVCLMGGAQADSEFQLKVEISPQDLSVISVLASR